MTSSETEPGADPNKKDSQEDFGKTMGMDGDTEAAFTGETNIRPEEWVGRQLGKYQITQLLGVGGMGVVLKAHDASIERDVAIKVLPAELSENENSLGRFLAEAKSAGKLNHPNTVTIYEIAQEGPLHYLAMEVVSGGSVEDRLIKQGAYPVAEATRIVIEASKGLAAAHAAGLVHRDIKPANLLLSEDGTVKVADFGLAKRSDPEALQMTKAGQIIGTPYFMSPEQCQSREVDTRSDIYSLGATYYSLLSGKSPFEESGSVVQVMFAHCNSERPDPRKIRAEVPPACVQVIERAMAPQPEQRYQTMDEMRVDLEAVLAAMSGAGIMLPSQSSMNLPNISGMSATAAPKPSSGKWGLIGLIGLASVAVVLLGIFFAGGFGSNEKTPLEQGIVEAGGGETAPAVIVPPTGEPIRVGVLHSLSGTMADSESPVVDAVLLAIDEVNEAGGLLGRPVEAIVADGRSDSAHFAVEAKRLIEEENVCTVFGCWTSASRKTVVPVFEELDHLLLYPVQYEGIEESPNVVYLGAAPNQQIIPAVKWAYAFENKRKFFLVGSDYVFPRTAHEIIKDQLKQLGAELVGEAFVPLGSSDVDAVVEQIQQAQPDVILNSLNGQTNRDFFAKLRKAGISPAKIPTISFSIGEEELRRMDVAAMTGDYAAWNYFQSIDSAENREFVSHFHKKYGPQRVVTDPMEAAYIGVHLWAQAVKDAESIEVADIRRALRNQRMRAPEGDVRIDSATQHTFKTPRIGKLQADGQFEIVWTASKPEQPEPYPATRTTEEWRAFLHDLYTGWGNQWAAPAVD